MDKYDKKTRSKIMSAIRSQRNKTTERSLRAYLVKYGVRGWKLNLRSVPGKPDFVFLKAKVAVFVDGCFWHGCPRCLRIPESNKEYWDRKLIRNKENDTKVTAALEQNGWKVLRFWEHELQDSPIKVKDKICEALQWRGYPLPDGSQNYDRLHGNNLTCPQK